MTEAEFRRWFQRHTAAFPGLRSWLAKMPPTGNDGLAGQSEILQNWATVLRDVDFLDAMAATEALARGDEEEPGAYDRHPSAVRAIARRLAAQRIRSRRPLIVDGEETYACLRCQDTGLVTIYHPRTLALARRGELTPGRLYTAAAACTCEAGRRHAWLMRYSPDRDILVPRPEPAAEEVMELLTERCRGPRPVEEGT